MNEFDIFHDAFVTRCIKTIKIRSFLRQASVSDFLTVAVQTLIKEETPISIVILIKLPLFLIIFHK